jgi:riboflavin synthase
VFTGIVKGVGTLAARRVHGTDQSLAFEYGEVLAPSSLAPGASIAVNGVCLTVADLGPQVFGADVSPETLAKTTLGQLAVGSRVNLEPSLVFGDAIGGHFVSGHVDGIGEVVAREAQGRTLRLRCRVPHALARFVAVKGAITIDGVSLTVNAVDGAVFEVTLIPATLERTVAAGYGAGTPVNLEVDLLSRYLDRLLEARVVPGSP